MKKMNNLLGIMLVCSACLFGCQSDNIDSTETNQEYSYDVDEVAKEWLSSMSDIIGNEEFPVDITYEVGEDVVIYTLDSPKAVEFAHDALLFGTTEYYESWDYAVESLMSWTTGITHDLYTKHLDYGVGIILGDVEQDEIVLSLLYDTVVYDYPNGIDIQ